jgi:hypothetical protein
MMNRSWMVLCRVVYKLNNSSPLKRATSTLGLTSLPTTSHLLSCNFAEEATSSSP